MGIACDYATVAAAVAAASPGDTITLNAGTETWASVLTITKGINLIGNGAANTVITNGAGDILIKYVPANLALNTPLRISAIGFDLDDSGGGILLDGSSQLAVIQTNIRIDNCTFTGVTGTGIQAITNYGMRGVIDNNTFTDIPYPLRSPLGNGGGSLWWDNWDAFNFGTAESMYFEDNTFTGVTLCLSDCQFANRYVFRYNTITPGASLYPLLDMHGNQPADGGMYSAFGGEVYENDIISDDDVRLIAHRGGKMLVFNNSLTGTGSFWQVQVEEEYNDNISPTTNPSPQHVNDSYYFNNLHGATRATLLCDAQVDYGGAIGLVPQADIDYWLEDAAFDGTSGVGVGLKAARPATCTVGVAYWATDEEILYKCLATNVWTTYYTPYTYPHPLRGEAGTKYRVLYNANGALTGSVPVDATEYDATDEATVEDAGTLARESYYAFVGWNTAADGSGTTYLPGATMTMPAADVTLYAQWRIKCALIAG